MKIVVDENTPRVTVAALRQFGHDIVDVRGTPQRGMEDQDLWGLAQASAAMLISTDKRFARKRAEPHYGVLVVRLRQANWRKIHERVMRAMRRYPPEQWPGLTVVMRDKAITVWRGEPPQG